MTLRTSAPVVLALAAICAHGPALAFDRDCGRRAVGCYDRIHQPDLYATFARPVLVRPAYREIVEAPPVIINQPQPVEIGRSRWYGVPALYPDTVQEAVTVHAPRVRWELRRGPSGDLTVPVIRREVVHEVVAPRWRYDRYSPVERPIYGVPVYAWVNRPVVIQPADVVIDHPPVYGTAYERVLVRPGADVWVPSRRGFFDRY